MTESPPHSPLLDLFGDSRAFQLSLPFNLFSTGTDLPASEHTSSHVSRPIGRSGERQPPREDNNALLIRDYHRSLGELHINNRPNYNYNQYIEGEDNIPRFDHRAEGTTYFPDQDEINSRFEYQPRYRFQSYSESSDSFSVSRVSDLEEAQSPESSKSPENPRRRYSEPCPSRSDFFNVYKVLDIENTHGCRSEPCPDCSDFFNANRALDQESQRRPCSEPFPSRSFFYTTNGTQDVIEPSHRNPVYNEDRHNAKKRKRSPEESPRDPDVIELSHTNRMCDEDKHISKKRKLSPEEAPEVSPEESPEVSPEVSPEESPEAPEVINPSDINQATHTIQRCNEDEHGGNKRKRSPEVSPGAQPCRPKKRQRITLNG